MNYNSDVFLQVRRKHEGIRLPLARIKTIMRQDSQVGLLPILSIQVSLEQVSP